MSEQLVIAIITTLGVIIVGVVVALINKIRQPKTEEFSFQCILPGKLHIFLRATDPIKAGIPKESAVYIIQDNAPSPIPDTLVQIGEKHQKIKELNFKIDYEYHANSANNPAILELAVKDSNGNPIWTGRQDFLPRKLKQRVRVPFSLKLNHNYDRPKVQIQVKPVAAGDFGFFIYSLGGTVVVTVK